MPKKISTTGLYIHIPFCKNRCSYCGFYSTTLGTEWKDKYVSALCKEMQLREKPTIGTIYVGGGTPSTLPEDNLTKLFDHIFRTYDVDAPEVTMEVNPDDVTPVFADRLRRLPVNRVSMGIQTFDNDRLRLLNRRHTAQQAHTAVELLRRTGIGNISIDLMFGFPTQTLQEWQTDIEEALRLDVEHISAYSLMYEEGTSLYRLRERGDIEECDEETWRNMYALLMDRLAEAGYEHYEISNFTRPCFHSKHNSNYWNCTPYIGIGAAAHSYDGNTRSWNIADVKQYISSIGHGVLPRDFESLDEDTKFNDLITTALRTRKGICLKSFEPYYRHLLLKNAEKHIERGLLNISDEHIHLTREGLFVCDNVMSDLMKTPSSG